MMADKKVTHVVKLQIQAGKANPAPPVGPALGPTGINIMQFVKTLMKKLQKMLEQYSQLFLQFMLIKLLNMC